MRFQQLQRLSVLAAGIFFLMSIIAVGILIHRLVNLALLAAVLSFGLMVLVLWSVYSIFVYEPPPGMIAVYRRGEELQWLTRGQIVWVIPKLRQVMREVPMKPQEVCVGIDSTTTKDEVQVRCLLYVRYRLRPHELGVTPAVFAAFTEAEWQRRVRHIIHDTLVRCLRDARWRDLRERKGLETLEAMVREQAQGPLAAQGVVLEELYWHYMEPLPAEQDTLEQVQEAALEGEAIYRRLRELSRRFRIRPQTMDELFLLALTAALSRESSEGPRVNLSLQWPPEGTEPEH